MESGYSSKFAVLKRSTKLRLYQSPDVPAENNEQNKKFNRTDEISLDAGTLIKIFQTKMPAMIGSSNKYSSSTVQVLDMVRHLPIYEQNLYECPQSSLLRVNESLWPYVISIDEPQLRLKMLQNDEHCKWLIYLKTHDFVSVSGDFCGKQDVRYDCIIRYIGPVLELQPVGYFFGLELLHLDSGFSPQSEKIQFAKKYVNCDPKLAILVTANWIQRIPKEEQKKFSAKDLFQDTFDRVKSAIGPSSSFTGNTSNSYNNNTSSLRREKKTAKKAKEATAQFYAETTDNSIKTKTDSATPIGKPDMDRKKDMLSSSSSSNTAAAIISDNDDFQQSVENYEKSLERRSTNTVQTQTQPQSGILKNKARKEQPNASLNVNGREIVFIETDDSSKQEPNVIVVEKRRNDIDLADLLVGDWPKTAGDAAAILNKSPKMLPSQDSIGGVNGGSLTQTPRIKSPNLLTHLNSSGGNSSSSSSSKKANDLYAESSKTQNAYEAPEQLPTVLDVDCMQVSPLQEVPDTDLGVGSMVEVNVPETTAHLYGVIRWIGVPPAVKEIMIGVELEDDHIDKQLLLTDGSFNGIPLFKCPPGRGLFVTADQCCNDRRFVGSEGAVGNDILNGVCEKKTNENGFKDAAQIFGNMECPKVPGAVAPIKCFSSNDLNELCGKFKGIQGHHNSCYLDVTLFSMFTFTPVFDAVLFRKPEKEDISHYLEVQTVLREEIVNPLRKNMFVRADRVMKLRKLLDQLSSVSGLTSEEKDPEEFLNSLLAQILRAEPFLKLNSGQDAYYYQLFVEKDERLSFPSVQQLFEQSFYTSDIKLKEVPSCLIIQMPRFGKNFKMYPRILPSQVLDVTDIIEESPRQCSVCGKLAEFECRDCFGVLQSGVGLESTSFCPNCLETVHQHAKRSNHTHRKLSVPQDFRVMEEHMNVPRLYMELFAVVCIETSHYVTFVKAGSGPDAPWCFFDSMADRKGEQNGYNIPEMITVPDLPQWLSEDGARIVNETSSNDKMLPEHAKRLFCDAYMCMYQSTDVMMYR